MADYEKERMATLANKLAQVLVQRWIQLLEDELTSESFWRLVEQTCGKGVAHQEAAKTILRGAQALLLVDSVFLRNAHEHFGAEHQP
jgi:hypothetical protein